MAGMTDRDHAGSESARAEWRQLRIALPIVALGIAALLWAVPSTPTESSSLGPEQRMAASSLRTIVIDPGHGGSAAGTTGPGGLTEKEITLDIAVRLRELIYRRIGLQVFLTRESDQDVPNEQRPEKANNWQGDLFLSIHANGYRLKTVRGPETYFLSAAATDSLARRVAGAENGGAEATEEPVQPDPSIDFILWDLAQTEHLRESSILAETIQQNLNALWQIQDRGVRQAPFIVLKGLTMPAVLVEVGYLSSPEDAALLADPFFRQQIAEELFRSIDSFRDEYAALTGAPPSP